jgi:hypothetical protein
LHALLLATFLTLSSITFGPELQSANKEVDRKSYVQEQIRQLIAMNLLRKWALPMLSVKGVAK